MTSNQPDVLAKKWEMFNTTEPNHHQGWLKLDETPFFAKKKNLVVFQRVPKVNDLGTYFGRGDFGKSL